MPVFSGFLHQHLQGEKLVGTASPTTKTTLTFLEELFGSWLEAVQDGFGKHLTRYAEKGNTTVVVATGTATGTSTGIPLSLQPLLNGVSKLFLC